MPDVIIYTDGGCRGNPGPGAWAFLVIDARNGKAFERTGGDRQTTNNRMEMLGAIEALKALKKDGLEVDLYSDSQYVVKAASEWMAGWKRRGWRRAQGPLQNVDLLQELDREMQRHRVTWRWLRGHDGDPGNERVDRLTNDGMDRIQRGQDADWERRTRWPELD